VEITLNSPEKAVFNRIKGSILAYLDRKNDLNWIMGVIGNNHDIARQVIRKMHIFFKQKNPQRFHQLLEEMDIIVE
jgi:hypothetical protein